MNKTKTIIVLILMLFGLISFYFELSMIDTLLILISIIILVITFLIKYRWQIYEWGVKEYYNKISADPINNYSDIFKALQELKSTCTRLDNHFKRF